MSAFKVSNKVLRLVASSAVRATPEGFKKATQFDYQKKLFGIGDNDFYEFLLHKLNWLNEKALNERYGDKITDNPELENAGHLSGRIPEIIKAIDCLLYQCSEGLVVHHPLMKELKELKRDLAVEFVEESADYKKANWG